MVVRIFAFFLRIILSLRYTITIINNDHFNKAKKGTLILPNHPAYMDPVILFSQLFKTYAPRPLVFETYYQNPLIKPFMKMLNALEVPDLEKISQSSKLKAQTSIEKLKQGLQQGENFIIWPSGRLKRNHLEVLGGTSAVSDILKAYPEVNLLLVRTNGLWGSRFSYAYKGNRPGLFTEFFYCLLFLFFNLLFFIPRRKINITIENADTKALQPFEKFKVNKFLEGWYNQVDEIKPVFRPYHFLLFWQKRQFPDLNKTSNSIIYQDFPLEFKAEVLQIIKEKISGIVVDELLPSNTELESLGIDSIQRLDLLLNLEQHFGFTSNFVPSTLGDLYLACSKTGGEPIPIKVPLEWIQSTRKIKESEILGETVLDSFLLRVIKSSKQVALIDDVSGVLTYRKLLLATLVIASMLSKNPAKHIGILLPASAGSFIGYFGCLLAGKIPVMLNWTTGPINLQHSIDLLGITNILTSQRFIDRVGITVQNAEWVFLEKVKGGTSSLKLLICIFQSYWPKLILNKTIKSINQETTAVILFTSGSEKQPKAVPLSHRNIIANQKSGTAFLGLSSQDTILAFLPPFHSFGLSVTGILPILLGMRVVYHPDPTDSAKLAAKLQSFKISLLVGTPTFLQHILEKASVKLLPNLRLIIMGAEKCPDHLFEKALKIAPNTQVLEGYGITECSPVVAVNPPFYSKKGSIGKALPSVDTLILDLDSNSTVQPGETGMLYLSGPTIFNGYLGNEELNPFKEINNKKWYSTGDLVSQDNEGYLFFKGRLKRFIKSGGEMISLPALEEVFIRKHPADENGSKVAIEGIEKDQRKFICLFTTTDLQLTQANQILAEAGFRGIMRLDKVTKLEQIPTLGTGKINYKILREQIEKECTTPT